MPGRVIRNRLHGTLSILKSIRQADLFSANGLRLISGARHMIEPGGLARHVRQ